MFNGFFWTEKSLARNKMTNDAEPVQPVMLLYLAKAMQATYFLDIGANIGLYSIFLANKANWKKLYAFEPAPGSYNEMRANLVLNKLTELISPQALALSNTTGEQSFIIFGDVSGANSLEATTFHQNNQDAQRISVNTMTLDDWSARLTPPFKNYSKIVLKVDTEGNELSVLEGAEKLLRNNVCLIQVECFASNIANLHGFMIKRNYHHLFDIGPNRYYTNYMFNFNLSELISNVSKQLITMKCYPLPDPVNPISYNINETSEGQPLIISVEDNIFNVPEYLIYVVREGIRERILGWQRDKIFHIDKSLLKDCTSGGINVFARSSDNHSAKINRFIPFTL